MTSQFEIRPVAILVSIVIAIVGTLFVKGKLEPKDIRSVLDETAKGVKMAKIHAVSNGYELTPSTLVAEDDSNLVFLVVSGFSEVEVGHKYEAYNSSGQRLQIFDIDANQPCECISVPSYATAKVVRFGPPKRFEVDPPVAAHAFSLSVRDLQKW